MTYSINNLSIGYKQKLIVKDIDLELNTTGLIYLRGENGAGKSTFARTISGNLEPLAGSFSKEFTDALYLVQDSVLFPSLNGYENITIFAKKKLDKKEIYHKAEELGIEKILPRSVKKYSYGEKMRLLVLAASLANNSIVIVDEIDKGLDQKNLERVHHYLEKIAESKLILCCSHSDHIEENSGQILFKEGKAIYQRKKSVCPKIIPKTKDYHPINLIVRALMKPSVMVLFSFLTMVMCFLTIILFSGTYYQKVNIQVETGFDYGFLSKSTLMTKEVLNDGDFKKDDLQASPDYFSFTYTDERQYPPIYFFEEDSIYCFDAMFFDLDVLKDENIVQNTDENFAIYPNENAVRNMKEVFGLSLNKLKTLPLQFIWAGSDKKTDQVYDIKIDVDLGSVVKDSSQFGDAKVYYSGNKFKEAMRDIVYVAEEEEYSLLDYLRYETNNSSLGYFNYVAKLDESQLKTYREDYLDEKKWNYGIQMDCPIYRKYFMAVEGKEIDLTLFTTLGYISLGLVVLTEISAYILIRHDSIESYLLLVLIKYPRRCLWMYYFNILFGPILVLISSLISIALGGLLWQMSIIALLLGLGFLISALADTNHAYQRLIGLIKTSGTL